MGRKPQTKEEWDALYKKTPRTHEEQEWLYEHTFDYDPTEEEVDSKYSKEFNEWADNF